MNQPKYKSNLLIFINQSNTVILIGDIRVGKTSFLFSLLKKSQSSIQPTMGIQFMTTSLQFNGKTIKIQIWDTTGAQTYRSITSTYYKKAQGVILMFDLTNHSSFENIKQWNKQVDEKANKFISKLLIGNKIDLIPEIKRQVNQEEITNFCIQNQMTYKQTSAIKGYNVKQALLQLIQKIYQSYQDNQHQQQANQYTSLFEINPNTTVLIEAPSGSQNNSQSNSCSKCC